MLEHLEAILAATENKQKFFLRINRYFPTRDPRYKLIARAYQTAKDAFRGKNRVDGETRYFEHLRAVTLILLEYLRITDEKLIVAALLHDIVEDIDGWTISRVEEEFGLEVALLVDWLTKPNSINFPTKEARNEFYHARFRFAPRTFFLIKLSDRLHNLLTLNCCSVENQKKKIAETRASYIFYAERELILLHEIEAAIERIEDSWVKQPITSALPAMG